MSNQSRIEFGTRPETFSWSSLGHDLRSLVGHIEVKHQSVLKHDELGAEGEQLDSAATPRHNSDVKVEAPSIYRCFLVQKKYYRGWQCLPLLTFERFIGKNLGCIRNRDPKANKWRMWGRTV